TIHLLKRTVCPHCWHGFAPEDVLWVSAHADLRGDERLGPEQQKRFPPTRFNLDGNALDERGMLCQYVACPKCHLTIPRGLLEMEPTSFSILGTPYCGKSFFLAAMAWELRRLLPLHFALSFLDADPISNRDLNEYERKVFLHERADELLPLANLIEKTQPTAEALFDAVFFGNQKVFYPKPFLFTVQLREEHPAYPIRQRLARVLCLYDNPRRPLSPG